jgi:hypothetical protein
MASEPLVRPSGRHAAARGRIRGDPGVGQEFDKPAGGMERQPLQDVFDVD